MRPYKNHNYVSPFGLVALLLGSLICGVITGILAHFLSQLIYLQILFPLFVSLLSIIVFDKLFRFSQVHDVGITIIAGVLFGISISIGYMGSPYILERQNYISQVENKYQVDGVTASKSFDSALLKHTGSTGFLGYLKIRAQEGDEFSSALVLNSVVVNTSNYTLKGFWAWFSWIINMLLFAIGPVYMGFDYRKQYYDFADHLWYNGKRKQIFVLPIEQEKELISALENNSISQVEALSVKDDDFPHPHIEIDLQYPQKLGNFVLMIINKTRYNEHHKVKRTLLTVWELSNSEAEILSNEVTQNIPSDFISL